MAIRAFGYVGFGAPDPEEWLRYGCEMLGLMPARALPGESFGTPADPGAGGPASGGSGRGADGSVYLKMDARQWRIAVHPDTAPGIHYLGFETAGRREFESTVEDLQKQGVRVEVESASQAAGRAVTALASLADPSGNRVELFYGPTVDHKFQSPVGASFVTGQGGDLGLGHVNLLVSDMEASLDFYIRVLGFRLSDYIVFGSEMSAQFLHCNARHHSIALTRVGDVEGVHHLMLEVIDIDQVGSALDRAERLSVPITSTLGRHRNDHALSFYMRSPAGFDVEIGCDVLRVDAGWTATQFCEGDIWGHKGLTAEAIQQQAEEQAS